MTNKSRQRNLRSSTNHKFFVVLAEAELCILVLCYEHLNLIVMTANYHKSDDESSWPAPATGCRALHVDHVQAADSASNDDNSCTLSYHKKSTEWKGLIR